MIEKFRHIWQILVLYAFLMLAGILLLHYTAISLSVNTYALTLSAMTGITIASYALIMSGATKGEKARGLFLLAGLSVKFLAYLIFILIFSLSGNNLTKPFIIAFFILYLFLTFFLIRILYKELN